MMKKHLLIPLLLLSLAACKRERPQPRPTLPLVYSIAADTLGTGRLVAQSGRRGGEGSIAIIGEPANTILLARRFQASDQVDNVDGRPVRDSLPDFAGEQFDVLMDACFSPYAHYWTTAENLPEDQRSQVLDSLREAAVLNAVNAWDSLSWRSAFDEAPLLRKSCAKMLILTSSLQARWGLFDVDTLQQLCGGECPVLSPVSCMLEDAYAAGARSMAVWTTRDVRNSGVWQSTLASMKLEGAVLAVIAPESALDIRTQLRGLLRQYRNTGRVLDALLIDSFTADLTPLRTEFNFIRREGTGESASFQSMLSPDFAIWDPSSSLIRATYGILRERHLFTHRIQRPVVRYYESVEAADGTPILLEASADYVQNTYVSNLH